MIQAMSRLRLRDAPHPLREFFFLFVASFVVGALMTPFTEGFGLRLVNGLMGVAAVLVGLVLVTNFNGATDYYSAFSKRRTWLGVDYSNYVLLEPRFIRIGAGLFIIVGVFFTIGALTGPL